MTTKEKILAMLESNRGQSISGASIAEELNISRNAVWKAVKELQKANHNIRAVTNKGYSLSEDSDILSVQGIAPYLLQKSVTERIYVHDVLESTNKTAKEMAVSGAEHSTIIIADRQTAGKGRYGRAFHSPQGCGLYMSLILHPARFNFSTPTLVTAFAAVSVCEAVEAVSDAAPKVKWVNDIFIDGKKICGILTEAVTDFESGNTQWLVVGIGINFKKPPEDYPEDLKQIAGAVFESEDVTATRNRLCAEVINRVLDGASYCEKEMLEKYKKRLFMLGKTVKVTSATENYEAIAVDIDEIGRLIVRKENGEALALSAGEISIKI